MSHSSKVSLSSFLVFPRQVLTWSENRHNNRNHLGVVISWIIDLLLHKSLVFHSQRLQLEGHERCQLYSS